jgi:hypothetical protein
LLGLMEIGDPIPTVPGWARPGSASEQNGCELGVSVLVPSGTEGECAEPPLPVNGGDMHELIASPYMEHFLLVRPGFRNAVNIGRARYEQLAAAVGGGQEPGWLAAAVARAWPGLDLTGRPVAEWLLVRPVSPYGYARASYELNLGCNYDCPMCYLGVKRFSGLDWDDRVKLLHAVAGAGVLFIQLTGGEPLIDKLFPDVYAMAWDLGMMISVSTNGSRLYSPKILSLLTTRRPYRITVSVYGATAAAYEAVTARRGSFHAFSRGMAAAFRAG